MALDPKITAYAQAANFAAFTTLRPDGQPVTQIMWVDADDEHVLINTERHRRKFRNVESDPRVTVTIWSAEDPYRYVEVRGTVTATVGGQAARDHIDALSRKYTGVDYQGTITSERVILQVTPEEVSQKSD